MTEKIGFWKWLNSSKKMQVLFFCVSMLVLSFLYLVSLEKIDRNFEMVDNDSSWVYQIDSIEQEEDLTICGWAFETGKIMQDTKYKLVLRDVKTEKDFYLKMTYGFLREDVNKYFMCEYDYSTSGFEARIKANKLDLKNRTYEILIKPERTRKAYSTGVYCVDGKMSFVNPNEYISLDVKGTDLEPIVKDGVLQVYRPDYGTYVYQYEGALYWIAEEWSEFASEQYVVQYQMNTTQPENLPENRKK